MLASFAKFFAGSIPRTFLKPKSKNGLSATPSLLPISMMYDFFLFNFKSLKYLFAALTKWFLNTFYVEDVYK